MTLTREFLLTHEKFHVHAVVGPTGTGKTAAAEPLARALGSPIVVADRIQCFTDLAVTSARPQATSQQGIVRHFPAQRRVRDGDLTAGQAAGSLARILRGLSTEHRVVVLEGGSISLLRELFSGHRLPFGFSVDVLPIGDRHEYRRRLLRRAEAMLMPEGGGAGLLEELAAAWRLEDQRDFVASVNGLEAVVAWCHTRGVDPSKVARTACSQELISELAEAIADVHLEHGRDQERAFAEIFGPEGARRFPGTLPHRPVDAGARRELADRRSGAAGHGAQAAISRPAVTVFCGARSGNSPAYLEQAAELGRQLAKAGIDVIYGGAAVGCMGALADAALQAGGQVFGVIPRPMLEVALHHRCLSHLRIVDSMHERKAVMAELADAFVAMPGGLGTLEELFEILTWNQLGILDKPCLLLDVDAFWTQTNRLLQHVVAAGFAGRADIARVRSCPDAESIAAALTAELPATRTPRAGRVRG